MPPPNFYFFIELWLPNYNIKASQIFAREASLLTDYCLPIAVHCNPQATSTFGSTNSRAAFTAH